MHPGNLVTYYYESKNKDIAQKKRSMMLGDRHMALPYLEKSTIYEETMRDKKRRIESGNALVLNLFGYTQVLSKHNETELYRDFPAIERIREQLVREE